MPATTNENDACVRCKAQKQGGDKCRASHTESEYSNTSLSQTHCTALLKFRGTTFPHGDPLKDQRFLEKALREEGGTGVTTALAKPRGGLLLLHTRLPLAAMRHHHNLKIAVSGQHRLIWGTVVYFHRSETTSGSTTTLRN